MILPREIQAWVKSLVLTILLLSAVCSWAEVAIPPLKSHVTDLTATLSTQEVSHLEHKLAAFEKTKGSQFAVLIVPTTQPETIEQYSIRVVETWKLGRENIDDGVLLLIAKKDRTLRIEVGYGLEGVLPDAMAKRIIAEIIVPQFKAGNFTDGIDAGIDAILGLIEGEPLPPQAKRGATHSTNLNGILDNILFIFIGFMVFGRLLQSLLGRFAGASVISIGAGFVGWLLFSSVVAALAIAVIAFFMGLFQSAAGGIYRNGRSSWPNDGYWSGGIGRGSSGGGFGGGGGGFGGGGASGRW
ncbi:YgcG family protein [Nitrosomonas sp. Nm166]|uniref:TPM domain-containing protein n=1 Tax=Nitrosomonas sp. Nm166 TaxID=1881054 RepID=UPI0008E72B11|nr:YgcG family protein [Nitrosomonas sp. Nm166]SFF14155.1 uncharacterized protein SAMN05428977_10555 [Nitrosomonas sp. Nm166]